MSALRNKRNKGLTGLAALPRATSAFGGGIVAMAVAGGCGTEPPLPVPAAIMITPDSAILPRLGDTVQLTATVQDMDGRTISGSQVNWASGDESVVTVNTTGLVTAVGEGVAPVRAAVEGVEEARSMVTVDLQRGVLVRIYEAMGGSRWFYNRNWGTDEPLHSWWGVGTDELGRVTRLLLGANALTGTIPAEIGALEALQSLSLSTNGLTGPIPAELGNLRELEWLGLGQNELTGPIPPELGNLQQLRRLSLSGNELTGPIPPELGNLRALEDLSLHDNSLTGPIPPGLGNLRALDYLRLSGNELTGPIPPELGNLEALEGLRLFGNELTGPIPPELGNLRALVVLELYRNNLTGQIPPEFGNLQRLLWLTLFDNNLTGPVPPELGRIRDLTRLEIDNTALTGRLPRELIGIRRLSRFYWYETDLCSPPDEEFQEWLASIYGRKGNGKCSS